MNILPHNLSTTHELLTSRGGLLAIATLMQKLNLTKLMDKHFVLPKSNRGFNPSEFLNSLILMQHEGGIRLDDLKYIKEDEAITKLLGLKNIPQPDSVGDWLRRTGTSGVNAISLINKELSRIALKQIKEVTLDIDASEIISNKKEAKKTYKFNQGYMPMIGHIAEINHVIETDFREGNTSPKTKNLEFIKKCENNLPDGVKVKYLRIDCAGYQKSIIKYCDKEKIHFAIRAIMSKKLRKYFNALDESQWDPVVKSNGNESNMCSHRTTHHISDYKEPFTLIIQRTPKSGQQQLDLNENSDEFETSGYTYRAIATSLDSMSDSEIINWYGARAEKSENKIKELMLDFGGAHMPCGQFQANALYFAICTLSYNLFVMLRNHLPEEFKKSRAKAVRLRVYAMAAKLIKHSRQYILKLQKTNKCLLSQIIDKIKRYQFYSVLE
jgi:hypothetical protein